MAKPAQKLTSSIVNSMLNSSGQTTPRSEDLPVGEEASSSRRRKARRLSDVKSVLVFLVSEGLKSVPEGESVRSDLPIVLTPRGKETLVGLPLGSKRNLHQVPVSASLDLFALEAESPLSVSLGGDDHVLHVRDGQAYLTSAAALGPETLTPRQQVALSRPRPDKPRWAEENRTTTQQVNMRLAPAFVAAIDAAAEAQGMSRTDLIKLAVEAFLEERRPS